MRAAADSDVDAEEVAENGPTADAREAVHPLLKALELQLLHYLVLKMCQPPTRPLLLNLKRLLPKRSLSRQLSVLSRDC